jgi:hypothetical protein
MALIREENGRYILKEEEKVEFYETSDDDT